MSNKYKTRIEIQIQGDGMEAWVILVLFLDKRSLLGVRAIFGEGGR